MDLARCVRFDHSGWKPDRDGGAGHRFRARTGEHLWVEVNLVPSDALARVSEADLQRELRKGDAAGEILVDFAVTQRNDLKVIWFIVQGAEPDADTAVYTGRLIVPFDRLNVWFHLQTVAARHPRWHRALLGLMALGFSSERRALARMRAHLARIARSVQVDPRLIEYGSREAPPESRREQPADHSGETTADWYWEAAIRGHAPAQYRLGLIHAMDRDDPHAQDRALYWYRAAAEQGLAEAQFALASRLDDESGGSPAFREALRWYYKAAKQGHAKAQLAYGCLHGAGLGVPRDPARAARWIRMVAEQGDPGAQCLLAQMHEDGTGVEQSPLEALIGYRKAADQGDGPAQDRLRELYKPRS